VLYTPERCESRAARHVHPMSGTARAHTQARTTQLPEFFSDIIAHIFRKMAVPLRWQT